MSHVSVRRLSETFEREPQVSRFGFLRAAHGVIAPGVPEPRIPDRLRRNFFLLDSTGLILYHLSMTIDK